jgi:hypothetical protein
MVRIYNNIQELEFVYDEVDGFFNNDTMQMLLQILPGLKCLSLPRLKTSVAIESFSLERLCIKSIQHSLLINANNLKTLIISDCEDYDNVELFSLMFCRTPNLEELKIDTHCSINFDSIKKSCPKLHTLKVFESSLSKDVVDEKIRIYRCPDDSRRHRIELRFEI